MAFDTQITDLVGGTIDQVACDQWAADACKEIIYKLPANLKAKCAAATTLNNSTTVMDMDAVGEILYVTRLSANSGGFQVPCREIPAQYGGLAEDSTDLNYYGTVGDPVYWIDGNTSDAATLYVKPTPEATQTAIVHHITYPTVDVSAVSVIANFPDEAEYLVVLYVAVKQLHQYMNSKRSDLPDFALPPAPTRTAQTAFSSYTSGLSETDPGIFSITAVAPVVPALTTITFSSVDSDIDASLPTYTTATLSAGGVYGANTPPSFTKPAVALDFAQVNTYIDTNEDIELASAKLQEISAQLNEYNANIQNEQVEFNKENVAYQANIQEAMQELQVANQVNIATAQGGLQLAISNEDRSQQRVFQNAINDMKVIFDNNSQSIQKYQSELSTYQANINKEVQEYGQKLSQYQLELNTSYQAWAKTESDNIQAYQADSSKYQAEIATRVQEFTQNLQKHSTDYQWYQGQYAQLKAEYQEGLQQLTGGGGRPPA